MQSELAQDETFQRAVVLIRDISLAPRKDPTVELSSEVMPTRLSPYLRERIVRLWKEHYMGNVLSIKGSITGYPDELAALMGGWTEAISYLFTALLHTMIVWVGHASLIRSVGDVTVVGVTAVLGRDTRLGSGWV